MTQVKHPVITYQIAKIHQKHVKVNSIMIKKLLVQVESYSYKRLAARFLRLGETI